MKKIFIIAFLSVIACSHQPAVQENATPALETTRQPDQLAREKELILGMPLTEAERTEIELQNQKTRAFLNLVPAPLATAIQSRASELMPKNFASRLNFHGNEHYIKEGSLVRTLPNNTEEVLIPAQWLPADARIAAYRWSPDQTKLAFGFTFFGSDWQIWRIYDYSKKQLITSAGDFYFKGFGGPGMSWMPDSKRILYPFDYDIASDFRGLRDPKILMHTLGLPRQADQIIFEKFETPSFTRWSAVAADDNSVVVFRTQGAAVVPAAAFLVSLQPRKIQALIPPNSHLGNVPSYGLVGIKNKILYLRSALPLGNVSSGVAANFGILRIDLNQVEPAKSVSYIVPPEGSNVLYQATLIGDKILTQYIHVDQSISFRLYNEQGQVLRQLWPQSVGFLNNYAHPSIPLGEGDATSTSAYFSFSSVTYPPVTVRVDTKTATFQPTPTGPVPFNPASVSVERHYYPSHDGRLIPMFVYKRKDQGQNPAQFAYLFSYGFIGVPNLPQWNRKFQLALELGGIVALPMIRGGGEFGARSQLEGTYKRENTFLDLVYASRWLKSKQKIVDQRVVAVGRSFGGLTGAVHYTHHQKEFNLISGIVPVTNWNQHFTGAGWWMADDFGVQRLSNGTTTLAHAQQLAQSIKTWDPGLNIGKLRGQNLIPGIFFSAQYDTNTTPHQTLHFVKNIQLVNPKAPIFMFQHPNGGHAARAELVDEFLFIARHFNLTTLSPLNK